MFTSSYFYILSEKMYQNVKKYDQIQAALQQKIRYIKAEIINYLMGTVSIIFIDIFDNQQKYSIQFDWI